MKKIIIIAVLFCISAMISKAETGLNTYSDKDFLNLFSNFQKDLKKNQGNIDLFEFLDKYVNINAFRENNNYIAKSCMNKLEYFVALLNYYYEDICNLSSKNNYFYAMCYLSKKSSHSYNLVIKTKNRVCTCSFYFQKIIDIIY